MFFLGHGVFILGKDLLCVEICSTVIYMKTTLSLRISQEMKKKLADRASELGMTITGYLMHLVTNDVKSSGK